MIKNNEIRVGNWLEWNKKPFKVCAIFRNVTENELWAKDNNELYPIPLTEEILLKCGWGKGEYDSEYIDNVSLKQEVLGYNVNNKMLYIETNADVIEINHIHYLHQLQNLYFALTGKELEINL